MAMQFDPVTGTVRDVAPNQGPSTSNVPAQIIASGQIPMLTDTGEPVYVKPSELKSAEALGYTYETPEAETARKDRATYGGGAGLAGASVLGALRGATLGVSDLAVKGADALLGTDMVGSMAKLREYNPLSSAGGDVGGAVASTLIPAGPLARVAGYTTKALGLGAEGLSTAAKIVRGAASEAIQGGVQGVGATVSDQVLNPTDDLAESLMRNVGVGTLLGGGTSVGLSGLGLAYEGAKKATGSAMKLVRGEGKALETAAEDIGAPIGGDLLGGGPSTLPGMPASPEVPNAPGIVQAGVEAPEVAAARASTPLESLVAKNDELNKYGGGPEALPRRDIHEGILERNPELKSEADQITLAMFDSKESLDAWRAVTQGLPSKEKRAFDATMQAQEKKAQALVLGEIENFGSGARTTPERSGQRLIENVQTAYKAEKEAANSMFREFSSTPFPDTFLGDLQENLAQVRGIGPMINRDVEGAIALKPWDATSGVTKEAYSAVKESLDALNRGDLTFDGFKNIRKTLRQVSINNPGAAEVIEPIRAALLGHVEKLVEMNNPGKQVREAFTKFAKNESRREVIEDVLGGALVPTRGEVGIASEKVIARALSSSQNAARLKAAVGEPAFNNLVGDYLQNIFDKSFDTAKGTLSAAKMRSQLARERPILAQVADQGVLNKLDDYLDYLKNTSQLEPLNASGTAKATGLISGFRRAGEQVLEASPGKAIAAIATGLDEQLQRKRAIYLVNELMSGRKVALEQVRQTDNEIGKGLKEFFSKGKDFTVKAAPAAAVAAGLSMNPEKYKKRFAEIAKIIENPEGMTARLAGNTARIANLDPAVHQAMVTKTIAAAQFLYSKAPKPPVGAPLDSDKTWRPSDAEIARWNRYVVAVQQPTSIIKAMNAGTLTNESVEAVKTVYPEMYHKISQAALAMASQKKDGLSYRDKLQLSILMQQPMTKALEPQNIKMLQQTIKAEEAGPGQTQPRPMNRKPSFGNADRAMTPSQRILTK